MSMFAKAKVIETKTPAKGKATDKREVEISGADELAQMEAFHKSIGTLIATMKEEVKSEVFNEFVKDGMEHKKSPDGFNAIENVSTIGATFKKRSTTSVLTDAEVAILKKNGISYETKIVQQEQFVINPKYSESQELLESVSEAIEGIKGMPEDFIMLQPEASKQVTSARSLDEIFQSKKKKATVRDLAKIVGVIALKPSTKADLSDVLEDLKEML